MTLAVTLLALPATAEEPALGSPRAVVERALSASPALESLEAQIAALGHAETQAGVWMDPMAAVEYASMPLTSPWPGQHMMSGIQLKVQQTFPAPGKTAAREAAAQGRTALARRRLDERRNELAGRVAEVYHRLALVRQLRALTAEHVTLVEQLIEVVRASYEVGRAKQHDLLRLEVLRDRLRDELSDFDEKDRVLLSGLNAALARPPDAPVTTPAKTPLPPAPPAIQTLVAAAESGSPTLARLSESERAEALGVARAEVETRPDVTAWLGYRIRTGVSGGDPGEDFVTAGASIPLPWFWNDRRWGALARQHRAAAQSAGQERASAWDAIRGELDGARARLVRGREKAARYEDELVPAAQRTLDAILSAYRVGRAEFATLYQAELELLAFQRTIRQAHSDAAVAAVHLDTLTGAHLRAGEGSP